MNETLQNALDSIPDWMLIECEGVRTAGLPKKQESLLLRIMEPIGVVAMVAAVLAVIIVAPGLLKQKPMGAASGTDTTVAESGTNTSEIEIPQPSEDLLRQIEKDYTDYRKELCGSESNYWVMCYYGSYNGAVAVRMGGLLYPQVECRDEVAGSVFYYGDTNFIEVWKDGMFFTLSEAYEQGILTKEDVSILAKTHKEGKFIDFRSFEFDFTLPVETEPADTTAEVETDIPQPSEDLLRQIEEAYIDYRIASSDVISDTADRNLLCRNVLRYYGSYHGAEAVTFDDSYNFDMSIAPGDLTGELVAGIRIGYDDSNRIYVWKDDEIFTIAEAYEQGVLTQEDVATLADMHNNKQYFDARSLYVRLLDSNDTNFRLEMPSKELKARFVEEYVVYMNSMRPDMDDYFKPSDVAIARWYGSFDDIHFLWISNHKLTYPAVLTAESYYGYTFRYNNGQSIMVWVEGEFITMSEAYKRGVLTEDMVSTVWSVIYTGQVIDMK